MSSYSGYPRDGYGLGLPGKARQEHLALGGFFKMRDCVCVWWVCTTMVWQKRARRRPDQEEREQKSRADRSSWRRIRAHR